MNYNVTILGAGLAGCEAALWLAGKGVQVDLYEQKPMHFSPAHKSEGFAELICSNSLKAERLDSASGLLKEEMRRMGSQLLQAAEVARVAAGGALAVDRDAFSAAVTRRVEQCPNITVKRERVAKVTGESGGSEEPQKKAPVRKSIKIGPNDPCPCGSGKKYKKCCYLKDKAAQ